MAPDGTNLKEFPLPIANSSPRIIARGSDGNMWFSEHTGNRMGRIAPDGTIAEFPIPTPNSMPRAIALGSDGNIWFGEFAGGKIGRVTPKGVITEFPIPDTRQRPEGACRRARRQCLVLGVQCQQDRPDHAGRTDHRIRSAAAERRPWRHHGGRRRQHVVRRARRADGRPQADGNRVGRITMDGKVTEFPIPSQTGSPINIAVGPDRNIWFTKRPCSVVSRPTGRSPSFPPARGTRARRG